MRITAGQPVPSPIKEILARQLLAAEIEVDGYAPGADIFTQTEAIIRLVGYYYDSTNTALNNAPAQNALVMSGAKAILSRYHVPPGVIV